MCISSEKIAVSGKVTLSIHEHTFGDFSISGRNIIVDLSEPQEVNLAFREVPRSIRSPRFVLAVSKLLDKRKVGIEMRDTSGLVVGLGYTYHSSLGHIKFKFLRTLKYFR